MKRYGEKKIQEREWHVIDRETKTSIAAFVTRSEARAHCELLNRAQTNQLIGEMLPAQTG